MGKLPRETDMPNMLPLVRACDQFRDALDEILSQPGYRRMIESEPKFNSFVEQTRAKVKKLKLVALQAADTATRGLHARTPCMGNGYATVQTQ
jgi:hypothetical protein